MAKMGAAATIRREPGLAPPSVPAPGFEPPEVADADRLARALHDSARPLIALASQLRRAVVDAPEGLKPALADAVERFERELAGAGWDERGLSAASYLLCAWVDEVVADTPWGAGGAGLLERFHGESSGSDRVLRLLSRLAERPQENRALLALFHACLSLGLHGHVPAGPSGTRQLEQLRTRVFLTLPRDETALSPPWHPAVKPGVPLWRRRLTLGALLLLALATLGVYTSSHLLLAAQVDEVFVSMQRLAADPPPTAATAAITPANGPARLAPPLAAEVSAGRITVRDEAHRSTVSIAAGQLFEGSGTQLASSAAPLLARIGSALAAHGGKVVVIGHTDGSDRRTARLPSAWHQSYEWAREAANALERTLPAHRLAVEGAADQDRPGPGPALPPRRVDIVLYP
ncbi:DotU family type IV/VI secretion system protein [Aquincola sp. S2]|uniref:DotU family type IV/VI secretion system protein n=1 Tax=Pseudaquabacterium terrae TaxID=2732868 RepID=A0ABX2EEZ0_9BURK|nr:type IVB secretion system protein IcmH/DotU [Aquabacterium terrae]NRF67182.1 DotU family type IV/VI secretion system protein [Aquabacterium terrae]